MLGAMVGNGPAGPQGQARIRGDSGVMQKRSRPKETNLGAAREKGGRQALKARLLLG